MASVISSSNIMPQARRLVPVAVSCCRYGVIPLSYVLASIAATWPLATDLWNSLPYGCEGEATVPLFNLWTIWWNSAWWSVTGEMPAGLSYWNAPIFHPATKAFAFSEPQPTSLVVAPLLWITGSRGLAYNVYLLLMLALNGTATYALLRRLGVNLGFSWLGGLLVLRLPYSFWQLGVVQLLALSGPVVTILALWEMGRREIEPAARSRSWIWATIAGIAAGLTYWSCNYYGLFLSVLLFMTAPILLIPAVRQWQTWGSCLLAAVIAGGMIAPFAAVQVRLSRENHWLDERPVSLAESLSADPGDYTLSLTTNLGYYPNAIRANRERIWRMGVGGLVMGLAIFGVTTGVIRRDRRRFTLFAAAFGTAAMLLSMGPTWAPFGFSPYRWLMDHYPGMGTIRSPFRFGVFTQLSLSWLAITGAEACIAILGRAGRFAAWRWGKTPAVLPRTGEPPAISSGPLSTGQWLLRGTPQVLATALLLLAVYEVWPARQELYRLPSLTEKPQWVEELTSLTGPDDVISCLPFPNAADVSVYEETALWMYWQTFHHRPLTNGYSGFFPSTFLTLRDALITFPDKASLDALEEAGTDYLIVRRDVYATSYIDDRDEDRCEWLFSDEIAEIDVYRLRRTKHP